MFRFLMWRLLGLLAVCAGLALIAWFLDGGPGRVLRGPPEQAFHVQIGAARERRRSRGADKLELGSGRRGLVVEAAGRARSRPRRPLAVLARWRARRRRRYVRLRIEAYRADRASAEAVVTMFEALHKRLLAPLVAAAAARPAVGRAGGASHCGSRHRSTTLRVAGGLLSARGSSGWLRPHCRRPIRTAALRPARSRSAAPPAVLRLKKHAEFIKRVKVARPLRARARTARSTAS